MEFKKEKQLSEDNAGIGALITGTLSQTSAHGIPHLVTATTKSMRFVWTLVVFIAFGIFVAQSYQLLDDYFNYNYSVNMELIYDSSPVFPAVTVCNMNPIKSNALERFDSVDLQGLGFAYEEDAADTMVGLVQSTYSQDWETINYTEPNTDLRGTVMDLVAKMNYSERRVMGHDLDGMMLKCTFDGSVCSPMNFTYFYNYLYGNCFTFNSGHQEIQKVSLAGPLYGLSLELFINQYQYISQMNHAAGVRVLVHDQGSMPFPEDSAISVPTGQETFIGISRVEIDRLPQPYTNCSAKETPHHFSDMLTNTSYTVEACQKSCLYELIYRQCRCAIAWYRYDDNVPPCLNDRKDINHSCFQAALLRYRRGTLTCDQCTLGCREIQYKSTVSSTSWPNAAFKGSLTYGISKINPDFERWIYENDDFLSINVVKFNVYYNQLYHEHISQRPAYQWTNLLSDLGGQVGLWIGVSMLTVFEFVLLVLEMVKYVCRKCSRNDRVGKIRQIQVGIDSTT